MHFDNFEINSASDSDNLVVTVTNDRQPEIREPHQQEAPGSPPIVSDATAPAVLASTAAATTAPVLLSMIPKSPVLVAAPVADPAPVDLPYRWWMTDSM